MTKIFEAGAAFVFDGAGRWVLMLGCFTALVAGFWLREAKIERLTRADERGQVIEEVRTKTDATIQKIQNAARSAVDRGPDGRPRGVLDPTTRD